MNDTGPIEGDGVYFDGLTSRRRIVRLRFADALEVHEDGALLAAWSWAAIRRAGVLRLACREAAELARIDISNAEFARAAQARCPHIDGDGAAGPGNLRAIIGWSLAAALSIALIAIYGVPAIAGRLTGFVPASVEARLGDAVSNQIDVVFGRKVCDQPDGVAALDKLARELAKAGGLPWPIVISVRASEIPHAFAIPGDQVFLLQGLIDRAHSPDELAGVLAHEFGHVAHRDGLREMIASGGAGFFFGLLLGDVSGSGALLIMSRTLFNAAHSREAEASADAFAAKAMLGLGRSPAPLGQFLLRMTGQQSQGVIALLASHPLTQDRLAALQAQDRPATGAPLLSEEEWAALKGICSAGP